MAHQAHNIPWNVLAATLQLKKVNPCQHDAENFHVRKQPDTIKKLTYFTNAFVTNVLDHARCDGAKYSETCVADSNPEKDSIVLTDLVAKKIEATVYRWRLDHTSEDEFGPVQHPQRKELCQHDDETTICQCPLPFKRRKLSAFQEQYSNNPCYNFFTCNGDGLFSVEIVKTLLLYGEMESLFRICAGPRVHLSRWWEQSICQCEISDVGWGEICRLAMYSYILLNVLHCFPETWDKAGASINDYTSTKVYQYVVHRCTKSGWTASDVPTYLHRQFYGIENGQFSNHPEPRDMKRWGHLLEGRYPRLSYYPYGLMSYNDFMAFEKPVAFQPSSGDISHVRWVLCQKGFPVELSNSILERASYSPQRRLPVPNHPLHPENRVELDKYLKYCWRLIIGCAMMGQALGMEMNYFLGKMVKTNIQDLFGCKCRVLFEDR
ncbi:hypothetical protein EDB80DRAFT_720733 [Ilyonectria destructans]|nr:hypothetical protein EDB80DRAFT_720733 [Ilyonectria destructans]